MKRATLLLDVQFDLEVATTLRELGHDVVRAWEPGVNLLDTQDRVLVTIEGGSPVDPQVAALHGGRVRMRVDGPLDVEQQVDLVCRLARALYVDDEGQPFVMDPGDSEVIGEA